MYLEPKRSQLPGVSESLGSSHQEACRLQCPKPMKLWEELGAFVRLQQNKSAERFNGGSLPTYSHTESLVKQTQEKMDGSHSLMTRFLSNGPIPHSSTHQAPT